MGVFGKRAPSHLIPVSPDNAASNDWVVLLEAGTIVGPSPDRLRVAKSTLEKKIVKRYNFFLRATHFLNVAASARSAVTAAITPSLQRRAPSAVLAAAVMHLGLVDLRLQEGGDAGVRRRVGEHAVDRVDPTLQRRPQAAAAASSVALAATIVVGRRLALALAMASLDRVKVAVSKLSNAFMPIVMSASFTVKACRSFGRLLRRRGDRQHVLERLHRLRRLRPAAWPSRSRAWCRSA